ncbi:MAG: ABC transporter ATP-binding protein [Firmicutes bacterium]|nr:ABC transporter ATP-binding protein [Bacillota bacterium]
MSEVIKVENLSKRYIISHQKRERYTALRDVLTESAKKWGQRVLNPFAKNANSDPAREEFWALKDVSFDIRQGDRVGIIGRNGAGKSTLLKVLSRITEPTTGRVTLRGRVASLLEVGTGFHPELTGRENIFLNGAILGMTRVEIKKKFDEIVDFAEVEKFLDTPVKRYSSGMYVRLAFAVAAHLEPEILVVDEVLAVGDVQFQKKCMGKMEEVGKEGRTVLFVSHNMATIRNLCNKGILLKDGQKNCDDNIEKVVEKYEEETFGDEAKTVTIPQLGVHLNYIKLYNDTGLIRPYMPLKIEFEILSEKGLNSLAFNLTISNSRCDGFLFSTSTIPHNNFKVDIKPGIHRFICLINNLNLCSGRYSLGFGISVPMVETIYFERSILDFEVSETVIKGSTLPSIPAYGMVYLDHTWEKVK